METVSSKIVIAFETKTIRNIIMNQIQIKNYEHLRALHVITDGGEHLY